MFWTRNKTSLSKNRCGSFIIKWMNQLKRLISAPVLEACERYISLLKIYFQQFRTFSFISRINYLSLSCVGFKSSHAFQRTRKIMLSYFYMHAIGMWRRQKMHWNDMPLFVRQLQIYSQIVMLHYRIFSKFSMLRKLSDTQSQFRLPNIVSIYFQFQTNDFNAK